MKRFSTIFLTLLSVFAVYAQAISVSSFKLLENDLTANTVGTMETDQNGEIAALIKVVTTQTGFTFDGGALGIVKTKQTPGEVWVYVPRGSKKISIKHPQLGVLRDYYFPIAVEAARTYEMVLVSGEVQTTLKQARTSQYVVFQLDPENAQVELDSIVLETIDGTATKMMKFGTYNYRVQAPKYLPEAGNVTVNDPNNKHIVNIKLKPNFSVVTLKVENEAEIWVNGELKGVSSWTGNLSPGTYEFETRKKNHRNVSLTCDIVVLSDPQTIVLQAPVPILGEADVNSSPSMAEVYIDGKKYGQTPLLIPDLIIGPHQVRICKEGYNNHSSTIIIKENVANSFSFHLDKKSETKSTTSINTEQMVTVSFHCNTSGGLFVDGKFMGSLSDNSTYQLLLGTHVIKVDNVIKSPYEKTIYVSPKNKNFNIILQDPPNWQNVRIVYSTEGLSSLEKIGSFSCPTYFAENIKKRAARLGGKVVYVDKSNENISLVNVFR